MSVTEDNHNLTLDGRPVRVVGRTGQVRATWQLLEGDVVLAEQEVLTGSVDLVGTLSTGTEVTATIEQSVVGPTRVTVRSGDETVGTFTGFVA